MNTRVEVVEEKKKKESSKCPSYLLERFSEMVQRTDTKESRLSCEIMDTVLDRCPCHAPATVCRQLTESSGSERVHGTDVMTLVQNDPMPVQSFQYRASRIADGS